MSEDRPDGRTTGADGTSSAPDDVVSEGAQSSDAGSPDGRIEFDRSEAAGEDGADRIPIATDDWPEPADRERAEPPGPEPNSAPVEPGEPTLEGALFVLLGAVAMTVVVIRLVSLLPAG